jgi:DNA-binding response OmpR family regulator
VATILIVDGGVLDRQHLAAVLAAHDHQAVEATDGAEALAAADAIRPAVVVTSVLLPTTDAHELVRRMRERPALAETPVVLLTELYHEREARRLAKDCGAVDVLVRQSSPHHMIHVVDEATTASPCTPGAAVDRVSVGHDHLRLVKSTLAARIDRTEAARQYMAAITEVAHHLASERDPVRLIQIVCAEARRMTLARAAAIGLVSEHRPAVPQAIVAAGLEMQMETLLPPHAPPPAGPLLSAVLGERRAVRTHKDDAVPDIPGIPPDFLPGASSLTVPIASATKVYGWLNLRSKLGTDEFTDADQWAAVALGTHAGIAYENTRIFDALHHRVTALEQELLRTAPRRARATADAREERPRPRQRARS